MGVVMATYKVFITETLHYEIFVEANCKETAEDTAVNDPNLWNHIGDELSVHASIHPEETLNEA